MQQKSCQKLLKSGHASEQFTLKRRWNSISPQNQFAPPKNAGAKNRNGWRIERLTNCEKNVTIVGQQGFDNSRTGYILVYS
jgi:hypothetical protein